MINFPKVKNQFYFFSGFLSQICEIISSFECLTPCFCQTSVLPASSLFCPVFVVTETYFESKNMDCNMWKDSKTWTREIVLLLVEYIYLFEKCTKTSTGIFLPSQSLFITVALTEGVRNILKPVTDKTTSVSYFWIYFTNHK